MRFNIRQMLVVVALIAFLIACFRPLLSEPIGSIRSALGTEHGRKVLSHEFLVATWPVTFMFGCEKPAELEFEFGKYEDGFRGWSDEEYDYHSIEVSPGQVVTVKDSDPEYFGVRFLAIAGTLCGWMVTILYWFGVCYVFFKAFRWANRAVPAKS